MAKSSDFFKRALSAKFKSRRLELDVATARRRRVVGIEDRLQTGLISAQLIADKIVDNRELIVRYDVVGFVIIVVTLLRAFK